ncbi:MAG TPA: FtsX-like permease family protein [Devosia sp.]|nr:FtsX-like permease family protein [Devosia sp.]
MSRLLRQIRFALADLKGDVRRFGLLLACLALGTGLVAAVGSVSANLERTLEREAGVLLGGDIEVTQEGEPIDAALVEQFRGLGEVAEVVDTNARASSEGQNALVDLLAAGSTYPLIGTISSPQLSSEVTLNEFLAERDGISGVLADPVLLQRLDVGLGSTVRIGGTPFEVRGTLSGVPDGPVRGVRLGLTALVPLESYNTLATRDIPLPGLSPLYRYKIRLGENLAVPEALAVLESLSASADWQVRTAREAIGPLVEYYDLFARYLLLIGLAAVLIGGSGVSQVVTAYMLERQRSVATMRALGATGSRLLVHYMAQILLLAILGVGIGVLAGALLSFALLTPLSAAIGFPLRGTLELVPLAAAAGFGLLASALFAYLPLLRAQQISPGVLFRSAVATLPPMPLRALTGLDIALPLLAAASAAIALAYVLTGDLALTLGAAAAAGLVLFVLQNVSKLLQFTIGLVRPGKAWVRGLLRGATAPGSAAAATIVSVGMGLTLLLSMVLVVSSLRAELIDAVVEDAPSLIATDLFSDEVETLQQFAQDGQIEWVSATPMLRGRVLRLDDREVASAGTGSPEARFLFSGDIPLGMERELPQGSRIEAGQWWAADYDGPPLVSLPSQLQREFGLEVGDVAEFELFGEVVQASIASFREYRFQEGLNFAVAFSPGFIEQYPLTYLASIKIHPGEDVPVQQALAAEFPDVNFVPVGDTIAQLSAALNQLAGVVLAAGALALTNGILVLIGATSTGRKQREAEAVIMKVLGATRRELLTSEVIYFVGLAIYAAVFATILGIVLASLVAGNVLGITLSLDATSLLVVAIGAVLLVTAVGVLNTRRILSVSPSQFLRGRVL